MLTSVYPAEALTRTRWVEARRPARTVVDPYRPYAFFVEEECGTSGAVEQIATVFITNRECPWRCVMCDLWRNTLTETVPVGAIPAQIDYALSRMRLAKAIKLYNAGSFFDPRAIPVEDYTAIAERVNGLEPVIVESHPALVGARCLEFRDMLSGRLEVAMGLETAHPEVLEKLNKRMTLEQFAAAADFLRGNNVDLRVFILVQPPFMNANEALDWAQRSLDFAFDCGATAASLIPTRGGNGAMEALAEAGEFAPPRLELVEAAARYGVGLGRGRVFVDLWDLKNISECNNCYELRLARLRAMNLRQVVLDEIVCSACGERN
jgi:radical SAM enzyme (TIGR01210 family)